MSVAVLQAYSSAARLAFLKLLAYRLRYVTGILTYFLFVSVNYFIWEAVFKNAGSGEVRGFTLEEMITYIAVGWMARSLYFSDVDEEIAELVRTGQVSMYLLRPIRFHILMLSQACGGFVFRLFFFTIPISIVLLVVFPVNLPASLYHGLAFILATLGSFLVFAEINFLLGLLCFSIKSIEGVMRAKYIFIQLFSGLLMPIAFFPDWLQYVMQILPFKLIAAVPLEIYLGKIPSSELYTVLLEVLSWALVLGFLSEYFWSRASRSLSIQGG